MAEWWDLLDGQIQRTTQDRTRRSVAVNYPVDLYPLVLAAARQRGLSMTAYQRRAVLAFACHDLQADWAAEMVHEPPVSTFVGGGKGELLAGRGFGPWRILSLEQPDE